MDLSAYLNHVMLDFSHSGKPMDIVYIESFNARFQHGCFNDPWFLIWIVQGKRSNHDGAIIINKDHTISSQRGRFRCVVKPSVAVKAWGRKYNEYLPHSFLGYSPPAPEPIRLENLTLAW
jgi:transposase InsO family protein